MNTINSMISLLLSDLPLVVSVLRYLNARLSAIVWMAVEQYRVNQQDATRVMEHQGKQVLR
jgi:hypothetical protein